MKAGPDQLLFRPEVAEARRMRLRGEVVLTQPVRTQALVLLLFGAIALTAAWVLLGTYARTEAARGILVTDLPSAKVVAIRPGQVAELMVREGQVVAAGQRLATIRVEQANEAGASGISEGLTAIEVQRGLADRQVRLSRERAASGRARLGATLAGFEQHRLDISSQIELQKQVVSSAEDALERVQSVAEKGFISKFEVERRRQAWLVARQDLGRLTQQINAIAAEAARTQAEMARIEADQGSEIASAQSSAETFAQQRAQLRTDRAYVLTAPVAGRVTALQATIGRTVDASLPLMIIIPEGSKVHADVYAPTRAIGFVKPGQEVRLLIDAFPYQRFGSFSGRIVRVSRTVLAPTELGVPLKIEEPVYRIEVEPSAQAVEAFGNRIPLQPGMTLTANMVLDRRSFGDWLLQPLTAVMNRDR